MSSMMTRKSKTAMKKSAPPVKTRNMDYPEKTKGSELAARLRKEANPLSEAKRIELFEKGMQIIYGGSGTKEKVGPGH